MEFETRQIHGENKNFFGARNTPIYNTGAFLISDLDKPIEEEIFTYSRKSNPTVSTFENIITDLEDGYNSVAFGSGMAAIFCTIITLASSGDNIISSKQLNGGVYNLFSKILSRFNIKVKYFDSNNPLELQTMIDHNTKMVYFDSIGNPMGNIPDFDTIVNISHKKHIPIIVDNTVATPYLFNPIKHGADVVIHSTAKFICSNSSTMGGIITCSSTFINKNNNSNIFINDMKNCTAQYLGACLSPFNAYNLICGVETLAVRVRAHEQNAKKIAVYLDNHPKVEKVFFAGLPDNKYYDIAKKYFLRGLPSLFGFTIKGNKESCNQFIGNLKLFKHQINFGDVKSLIMRPYSELYTEMPNDWKSEFEFDERYFRVSIGLENSDDLIYDLDKALKNIY